MLTPGGIRIHRLYGPFFDLKKKLEKTGKMRREAVEMEERRNKEEALIYHEVSVLIKIKLDEAWVIFPCQFVSVMYFYIRLLC